MNLFVFKSFAHDYPVKSREHAFTLRRAVVIARRVLKHQLTLVLHLHELLPSLVVRDRHLVLVLHHNVHLLSFFNIHPLSLVYFQHRSVLVIVKRTVLLHIRLFFKLLLLIFVNPIFDAEFFIPVPDHVKPSQQERLAAGEANRILAAWIDAPGAWNIDSWQSLYALLGVLVFFFEAEFNYFSELHGCETRSERYIFLEFICIILKLLLNFDFLAGCELINADGVDGLLLIQLRQYLIYLGD